MNNTITVNQNPIKGNKRGYMRDIDKVNTIIKLKEEGKSFSQIGKILNISKQAAHFKYQREIKYQQINNF
jgi:orotate phosphoribosyltransferase-like protein